MTDLEKVESILRHVRNVQDNAILIAKKLIEKGEVVTGKLLITNSLSHDLSKFHGIEWDDLSKSTKNKSKLSVAISNHNRCNPHHPEFWPSIHEMPRVYVAEMAADWKSRSEEFGTSIRQWIDEKATERFSFKKSDKIYEEIMEFVDMICEKPF
jgi:hypothetical protein